MKDIGNIRIYRGQSKNVRLHNKKLAAKLVAWLSDSERIDVLASSLGVSVNELIKFARTHGDIVADNVIIEGVGNSIKNIASTESVSNIIINGYFTLECYTRFDINRGKLIDLILFLYRRGHDRPCVTKIVGLSTKMTKILLLLGIEREYRFLNIGNRDCNIVASMQMYGYEYSFFLGNINTPFVAGVCPVGKWKGQKRLIPITIELRTCIIRGDKFEKIFYDHKTLPAGAVSVEL